MKREVKTAKRKKSPSRPDLRTKAGRAWKAKQAAKAARGKAAAREARRHFVEETMKVSGSWLTPEQVASAAGAANIPTGFQEPFIYNIPLSEIQVVKGEMVLDAYGPPTTGQVGKATSAYWRVGV